MKSLQSEIQKLNERVSALEQKLQKEESMTTHKNNISDDKIVPYEVQQGKMTYSGKYQSPDGTMGATFGANCDVMRLLQSDSFKLANVLSAFSSQERIGILKQLVQYKQTANQLMQSLDFKTTGKLYHHLSFLEKTGLVMKSGERFHVTTKYIGFLLLIFAGAKGIAGNRFE